MTFHQIFMKRNPSGMCKLFENIFGNLPFLSFYIYCVRVFVCILKTTLLSGKAI